MQRKNRILILAALIVSVFCAALPVITGRASFSVPENSKLYEAKLIPSDSLGPGSDEADGFGEGKTGTVPVLNELLFLDLSGLSAGVFKGPSYYGNASAENTGVPPASADNDAVQAEDAADVTGLTTLPQLLPPGGRSHKADYIKVALKYGSSTVQKLEISSEHGFIYASCSNNGWSEVYNLQNYVNLIVSYNNKTHKIEARDKDGNLVLPSVIAKGAFLSAASDRDKAIVSIAGKKYRDGVCVNLASGSKLNVGNYITTEHYLWGVIHREMSASNHLEALKAQALCCRSYAYKCRGKHSSSGFDICGNPGCCQAYGGVSSEMPRTIQACKQTAGKYILYNGKVVRAYYHASSGGYTVGTENVWSSKTGYCKAVKDPYGKTSGTSHVYTFSQLQKKLSSYKGGKYSVGKIKSVETVSTLAGGTAAKVRFTGSKGSSVMTASQIYSMYNFASPRIGLKVTAPKGSADGKVNFIVYGRGHCVGMPQVSAEKMAKQGYTAEKIIKYFYSGVTIGTI